MGSKEYKSFWRGSEAGHSIWSKRWFSVYFVFAAIFFNQRYAFVFISNSFISLNLKFLSYKYFDEMALGLFSAAIMESGTALSSWGLSRTSKEAAFATGVALGIITTDSQTLVNRLKTVPEKDLQRIATITMGAVSFKR